MARDDDYNYGVVLDAGSSGTRVYVYRWLKNEIARQGDTEHTKTLPVLDTKDKWTKKVHPGISTFGDKAGLVGPEHLKDLLSHALDVVPKDAVQDTPIFLLATAGMRLLPEYQRTTLLRNTCSYIKSETRFLISDCDLHIQVISGETEGIYGWIAANYLLGGFDEPKEHDHGKGHHTYGFLDLGGASAQIAFAPNSTEAEKHANDLKLVRFRMIDGTTQEHRVFVTTWLGFGVNEARKRYLRLLLEAYDTDSILDPCLPPGYTVILDPNTISPDTEAFAPERHLIGTGLFDECLKRTYPLLEKDLPCLDQPCLVNGQHVPAIDFDVNHFVGISEYWHTTHEIFETAHKDKSYDFQTYQTRVKEFCQRPWSETQAEIAGKVYGHKVDEKTAYEVCFKASWLINLLHDGIGVPRIGLEATPSQHNVTKAVVESAKQKGYLDPFQAINKIKSTEVSWTMGKMALYASADVPPSDISETDSYPVGFGANVPGNPIPFDFQYPGGGRLQTSPDPITSQPKGSQSLTDQISAPILKSDSSHRIPGLLFFLIIITIALFYLCGRDRRTRFIFKYLPHSPSSSLNLGISKKPTHTTNMTTRTRISSLLSRLLHRRRTSADHDSDDRALEEGSTAHLVPSTLELNDLVITYDSDSDVSTTTSRKKNPALSRSKSGYASPTTNRSRTPRPMLTSSQSAVSVFAHADRLRPDAFDRRGVLVRTESRERIPGVGHKSRSGSLSPTRSARGKDGYL